jgi:uncharacterized protein YndB with AHSA1/START domain
MSDVRTGPPGDRVTVSVQVAVSTDIAFSAFTEDIDLWWRRGLPYRAGGLGGVLHFEPQAGGRMYETIESKAGVRIVESGRITAWEPPRRLAFEWRAINFGPNDRTMVEVTFEPRGRGTLVTLRHSGWSAIPLDHPVRHGQDVAVFMRGMGMWWGDLMTGFREHLTKTA